MSHRWNGRDEPRTQDQVADRYTLTVSGFAATLPRGACGHLLCAGRDGCAFLPRRSWHRREGS